MSNKEKAHLNTSIYGVMCNMRANNTCPEYPFFEGEHITEKGTQKFLLERELEPIEESKKPPVFRLSCIHVKMLAYIISQYLKEHAQYKLKDGKQTLTFPCTDTPVPTYVSNVKIDLMQYIRDCYNADKKQVNPDEMTPEQKKQKLKKLREIIDTISIYRLKFDYKRGAETIGFIQRGWKYDREKSVMLLNLDQRLLSFLIKTNSINTISNRYLKTFNENDLSCFFTIMHNYEMNKKDRPKQAKRLTFGQLIKNLPVPSYDEVKAKKGWRQAIAEPLYNALEHLCDIGFLGTLETGKNGKLERKKTKGWYVIEKTKEGEKENEDYLLIKDFETWKKCIVEVNILED